jgi:F-type H+-transporting ATPase subunit gamma
MATTKEIKNRIKSVKDTQKITNAMYLISSTKMTKARGNWTIPDLTLRC